MPEKTELVFTPIAQLTIKAIGGDGKKAIKDEKQVYMGRIYGEVSEIKIKEARSGETYKLILGEFRGVNAAGEGFESNKLMLPGTLLEQLEAKLKTADGNAIKFGYDIFSNPDEKSTIGYSYAYKQIIKTEAHDRLQAMTAEVSAAPMPMTTKAVDKSKAKA